MKILSYPQAAKEICQRLASDQCGFIATAVSPWHAMGVDAWVHHLRRSGDTRGGVVLLMAHPTGGRLVSDDDVPVCRDDSLVRILQVESHLSGRLVSLVVQLVWLFCRMVRLVCSPRVKASEQLPFYLASPRIPDLFTLLHVFKSPALRHRQVRFVLLDEGLATYMDSDSIDSVRRVDRQLFQKGLLARELDIVVRKVYHRIHGWVTRRYPTELRFLFQPSSEQQALALCAQVADDYRAVTARRYAAKKSTWGSAESEPKALIVPQPWSEYREINAEDESQFFASLIDQLKVAGYQVLLKPHPRETAGKYDHLVRSTGCQLLDSADSVETYFAQLRCEDIVLGHNTTSLLTAAALFGLKTYTLGDAFSAQASTGQVFREFQKRFKQLAGPWASDVRDLPGRTAA